MSNEAKKKVNIKESELVTMIDKIVNDAVAGKKKEWLAEQESKGDKTAILETKLAELTAKVNKLTENKK